MWAGIHLVSFPFHAFEDISHHDLTVQRCIFLQYRGVMQVGLKQRAIKPSQLIGHIYAPRLQLCLAFRGVVFNDLLAQYPAARAAAYG